MPAIWRGDGRARFAIMTTVRTNEHTTFDESIELDRRAARPGNVNFRTQFSAICRELSAVSRVSPIIDSGSWAWRWVKQTGTPLKLPRSPHADLSLHQLLSRNELALLRALMPTCANFKFSPARASIAVSLCKAMT
jgi:hypothetical protein